STEYPWLAPGVSGPVASSTGATVCVPVVRRASRSTLVPYTTLFRSVHEIMCRCWHCLRCRLLRCRLLRCRLLRITGLWWIACRRSEEHTSELQSRENRVCRLLLRNRSRSRGEGRGLQCTGGGDRAAH